MRVDAAPSVSHRRIPRLGDSQSRKRAANSLVHPVTPRETVFIMLIRRQICPLFQRELLSPIFKAVCSTNILEKIIWNKNRHRHVKIWQTHGELSPNSIYYSHVYSVCGMCVCVHIYVYIPLNKWAQGNIQSNFVTVQCRGRQGPVKELESMSLMMIVLIAC